MLEVQSPTEAELGIEIPLSRLPGPRFTLDRAIGAYRLGAIRPDFLNWYTTDERFLLSAMPLAAGLLRQVKRPRIVAAICTPPCIDVRLAKALGLSARYVEGYKDAWFGVTPGILSDEYASGWCDGDDARTHFQAKGGA